MFGGIKLWGDWFNHLIGLGGVLGIPSLDIAAAAPHVADEHHAGARRVHRRAAVAPVPASTARRSWSIVWGALGGSLMGIGAALAGGCTTGGFFVPMLHASPAGFVMLGRADGRRGRSA
ncbi:MAG: YeeE/YedE family protein [Chromatiales bacterium]|nr:YeeE/YedE family protein [Chromatiales bacterium]